MIYVGRSLLSPRGTREPALIDPALPIDKRRPDATGTSMGYWPAYHSITPGARAAYLDWLEAGRRHPGAYIGFVFLFMYGLERRVTVDMREHSEEVESELPAIRAEMEALHSLYGGDGSFRGYSERFIGLLDFL